MISTDQRRVAYGMVIVLCAAWLVLGVALVVTAYTVPLGMDGGGGFLFVFAVAGVGITVTAVAVLVTGIRFVRRVDEGLWPWRTVVMAAGIGCVASALAGWWVAGLLPAVALLLASRSSRSPVSPPCCTPCRSTEQRRHDAASLVRHDVLRPLPAGGQHPAVDHGFQRLHLA